MESELYKKVYQLVMKIANGRTIKRATFFDADIILTYLWAVLHDRPIYWACNKKNWPIYYRRRPLPTASTMTRRLRKQGVQNLLKEAEQALIKRFPPSICRWIDAKPLPIGKNSKDKQSGFGPAAYGHVSRHAEDPPVGNEGQRFAPQGRFPGTSFGIFPPVPPRRGDTGERSAPGRSGARSTGRRAQRRPSPRR